MKSSVAGPGYFIDVRIYKYYTDKFQKELPSNNHEGRRKMKQYYHVDLLSWIKDLNKPIHKSSETSLQRKK